MSGIGRSMVDSDQLDASYFVTLLQGRERGGIRCEVVKPTCRRFWRNDGRKLAYLTVDGNLHVADTGNGSPSEVQVIAAPQGGAITDFSWPS